MYKCFYYFLLVSLISPFLIEGKRGAFTDPNKISISFPSKGSLVFSQQKARIIWSTNYSPYLLGGDLYYNIQEDTTQYSIAKNILKQDSLGYYFVNPNYSGKGKLRIYDVNNNDIYAETNFFTMIQNPPIVIYGMQNGAVIKPDSSMAITFMGIQIPKVDIQFSPDAGDNWSYIRKDYMLDSSASQEYSVNWHIPNINSSRCRIRISSKYGGDSCMLYITNKETIGEFPLQIGNKWFYKFYSDVPNEFPKSICLYSILKRVVNIQAKDYYEMEFYLKQRDTSSSFVLFNTKYLRQENNLIIEYVNNSEKTFCDFSNISFFSYLHYEKIVGKLYRTYSSFKYGTDNFIICDSLGFSRVFYDESNQGMFYFYLTGYVFNGSVHGEVIENITLPVTKPVHSSLPERFLLSQNYPNPFNPVTTIKYTLPLVETLHAVSLQHVTLRVYDLLGRVVATLVDEEKSPGNYQVQFNGGNLSSGTYIYRLSAGLFNQSKKFILLK